AILAGIVLFCCIKGYSQRIFTVHFDFNKHVLTNSARIQLDSILLAEKQNLPVGIFTLDGYCDAIGSDAYNEHLSKNRVLAVKKYLLNHGLETGSIAGAIAHGEKDPLNENKTEEERQLNRRVVISFNLQGSEDVKSLMEKVADTATKAGTTIVLKNINFYGGTPFPLPESSATMDELLETMRVNHTLVIEIRGHICCVAYPDDSPYQNTGTGLSEERAKTIYAYLTGNGIDAKRVSYKGFGHSMPIYPYPEQTEEERIANRRVEMKIISK
ncbi:MAG TPA: OmpA family protein, partial [Chitinophagaceae bacterium]|nr:OmpA family protein [Chitinophagaceae bacterium]